VAKRSRGHVSREPSPAPQRAQRAARRRPARRQVEQPFFERYRSLIIGGLALAGLVVIGFLFFQGATRAAYECDTQLTPGPSEPVPTRPPATPTPSPSPSISPSASPTGGSPAPATGSPSPTGASPSPTGASPSPTAASPSPSVSPTASPTPMPDPTARLGFTLSDLGAFHVSDAGKTIRYDYCPPGSGEHYSIAGAPMPAAVYQPAQERAPGYWIHNLEHGYVVLLYRCPSGQLGVGDCVTREEMNAMQALYDESPQPPLSGCAKKVVVARFDSMTTDFALLSWDRALLMDEFDLDKALLYAEQWMEHVAAPEPNVCP
jgi:hypothetical protein